MASITPKTTRVKILPLSTPPFKLSNLKEAIPPHCFKRSILKSFSYVAYDFAIISFFYHVASNHFSLLPLPLSYVAWPVYWLCQSVMLGALWVLAHECGHHAFSGYAWLDNTVGMILHTSLGVPYFSWRISHRKHHSNVGSIEYDEIYVPKRKSQTPSIFKYLKNPIGGTVKIIVLLTFGWYWYLLFNFAGRHYERFASHFDPYSPIFSEKERPLVWISNATLVAYVYVLYSLAMVKGFPWLFCHYGAPYVLMNLWLILQTYLNHTHPTVPRYDSSEWDWLRGALSTVDRDYGILNDVWHNASNTHVVHHLFSTIPHYHAMEATNAIKPILGEYYNFDGTPILKAIWRETTECLYVEPDEGDSSKGVYWFNKEL